MRKGWFIIPGVQDGDRTLEEQMLGVTAALAEAKGKTVLDLGCAEGLIGREFARAGAIDVEGIESLEVHAAVGRTQCAGLPVYFSVLDLQDHSARMLAIGGIKQYDIVLSLGVCHKLQYPADGIRFSARSSLDLVLIRLCASEEAKTGILRSKHYHDNACDVGAIMVEEGFELERVLPGPREETVHYWRRRA